MSPITVQLTSIIYSFTILLWNKNVLKLWDSTSNMMMFCIVTAGVAGARFRLAIPAVILLVLHCGCARGLGSVCSPTGGSGRRVRAVYEVWCSGFILSSLIKAPVNDYGHLDIRNMLVKVFWSSPCLACTHIVRMLSTTLLYSIRLQTMN
jgi:hypothetical protein